MTLTKIDVKDETGSAKLVFFNKSYIKNTFRPGDSILVFGKVKKKFNNLELTSCELEKPDSSEDPRGRKKSSIRSVF